MYVQNTLGARCVGALPSMTVAIKAQRVLLANGIEAQVVSLSGKETRRGCAFGLEFSCDREGAVRTALRGARIAVSQYIRKGSDGI